MKVLMTADTVGGVWTYALELADALAPHGVDVVLATMGGPLTADRRRQAGASAVIAVHDSGFALEWMDDPWDDVDAAGAWLLALAEDVGADLVHLNGYAHAALPWPVATVVVAHSDVLTWWTAVRREPAPPTWDAYRRRVRSGLAAADAVVAPTTAVLEQIRTTYGLAGGRVVPNARRAGWAQPAAKEPMVFAAGRVWDEAKNLGALAAVAPRLPWPVHVAGEVAPPGARPAPDRPETEGIVLLGALAPEQVAAMMARAAIFALPARYEPFGLAALEAGLAGCALVLGDIPSLREVWGDAASFVDPFDEEALAAALTALTNDPERLADLGRRARARAAGYDHARMAAGYLAVYAAARAGRLDAVVAGGSA